MSKYRKKPVVIEAVLWTGKNQREMYDFLSETKDRTILLNGKNFTIDLCNGECQVGDLYIKTLEGNMKANLGDYIIKGINGEFYPCKPDIFEKTYEPVLDSEAHEGVKLCFEETGEEMIIKPYKPDDFFNSQIKS